jgi:ribosomal protein S18 acetylase RimI-like enzyme
VVHYRTFRNDDPPRLAQIWNAAFTGRGSVNLRHSGPLEHYVFAKSYFDPAGLILAFDDNTPVGFAHGGFGPASGEAALSTDSGVTCAVGVIPSHRRRGIGSELLRRCESYLRERGATTLYAGSMPPMNPFYFGLYGGSESPGFLVSDPEAEVFLTRHGYRIWDTCLVYQARLGSMLNVPDGRFAGLRLRFDVRAQQKGRPASWWQACVLGPVDLLEFSLEEKGTNQSVARAAVWEMEGFAQRWSEAALGIVGVEVREDKRRQGLAKYLLAQMLRYLQDQYFTLAEVQTMERNQAAIKLYQCLGFKQVDMGRIYRLDA